MRRTTLRRTWVAAALALALPASRAHASGFQLIEQNGSGMGNAYAGQAAAAEDASTVFFNPAGLTRLPGFQAAASLNFIRPSSDFNDDGSTPATFQTSLGGTGGDGGSLELVPNAYASYEVLPGFLWAGFGVNVPFGLTTEWDSGWEGRFHAIKSRVQTINLNPTLALKVLPWLSVGAGVSAQWFDAELTNAVNYSAVALAAGGAAAFGALAAAGCGTAQGGCEGVAKVSGDSWGWGWNVGLLADFPTRTRLGLTYRSGPKQDIEGDVTFRNRPALLDPALPNGPVKTTIELPDTVSVAAAQGLTRRLELLADFTWTDWSSLKNLSIYRRNGTPLASTPLQFEDTFRVGLGANYQVTEPLKVRLGLAYDKTPVRDRYRTPRLPDEDRFWVAGGVQWAFTRQLAVDLGAAYLVVQDAKSDLPNVDPSPPSGFSAPPTGHLVGSYGANVWVASVQARYAL